MFKASHLLCRVASLCCFAVGLPVSLCLYTVNNGLGFTSCYNHKSQASKKTLSNGKHGGGQRVWLLALHVGCQKENAQTTYHYMHCIPGLGDCRSSTALSIRNCKAAHWSPTAQPLVHGKALSPQGLPAGKPSSVAIRPHWNISMLAGMGTGWKTHVV